LYFILNDGLEKCSNALTSPQAKGDEFKIKRINYYEIRYCFFYSL